MLGKCWVYGECESCESDECGEYDWGSKLEFTHNLHLSSGWGGLLSEEPLQGWRALLIRF
jgi:hypothetical protein